MKRSVRQNRKFFRQGIALLMVTMFGIVAAYGQTYPWQQDHATVSASGNIEWAPHAFTYEAGATVRYIDYENGDDANSGTSTSDPWKHHPWDSRATGNSANCSGVVTYVFKRGVTYRMYKAPGVSDRLKMTCDESGLPGDPIRLTSDPNWGTGDAIIANTMVVPSTWQQATASDVPARMDHTNVWYVDVDGWYPGDPDHPSSTTKMFYRSITLYKVDGEEVSDVHLARDPNWQEPGANFASDYWHQWDGQKKMPKIDDNGDTIRDAENNIVEVTLSYDEDLKGFPMDYFHGAYVWSHYSSFMGTPTRQSPISPNSGHYNPYEGGLKSPHITKVAGTRYFIENLPQYLDTVNEYYFDPVDDDGDGRPEGGRLFVRVATGENPNTMQFEMGSSFTSIAINDQSYIEISGLRFSRSARGAFNAGTMVNVTGNCKKIAVTNCEFDYLTDNTLMFECDGDDDEMDSILVADNDFFHNKSGGIWIKGRGRNDTEASWIPGGELKHVDVLRNRVRYNGFMPNLGPYSNVPSISINYPNTAVIAGNVVYRSFGSGLVVFGGRSGGTDAGAPNYKVPLTRLFVYQNKMEHCALGTNDYGGLALWQGGPIYSYNNVSGNSVGHWPGGINNSGTTNLSYPLYIDGGFKMYNFNNILWQRKDEDGTDPYASTRSAYFNVFGFMNHLVNNTIVGAGNGFGGTSGNRNDMHGNLLVDITHDFIHSNHGGNPSLIGGGDDGTSGIDGAGTLAYTNNIFHGPAKAGTLVTIAQGAESDIQADAISDMALQMQNYPVREGALGVGLGNQNMPITTTIPLAERPSTSDADFRPTATSPALNNGINYFIPFSLYATVGEWHFNQNNNNPEQVLDYHYYMTEAYFARHSYYKVPTFELTVDTANAESYILSPNEDWTNGAMQFDGSRHAVCAHSKMTEDIVMVINDSWDGGSYKELPPAPWTYPTPSGGYKDDGLTPIFGDDQVMTYPGSERRTPDMDTCNMLIEASFRVDALTANSVIANKYDGSTGYQLFVNSAGNVVFKVAAGSDYTVSTSESVNDGKWHHVLAEIDRASGRMSIYLDGQLSDEQTVSLSPTASLSNTADFMVAKNSAANDSYFSGAIDYLKVCQGTLADALTTIDELYTWQTDGPAKHDFTGADPKGKRDVGAIEVGNTDIAFPDVLMGWDFDGEGETTSSVADFSVAEVTEDSPSGVITMGDGLAPEDWSWPGGFTFKYSKEPTLADAIADNDYVEFSFAPNEGEKVDLTSIVMNTMNQYGESVEQFALFSDRLPYTAGNEITSGGVPTTTEGNMIINLSGFDNLTDTITFRVYWYGGTNNYSIVGIAGKVGYDLSIMGVVQDLVKVDNAGTTETYQVKTYSDEPAFLVYDIYNNKQSIELLGNGYQKINLAYDVTANTVLEFDYQATDEGSIQGILFDTDDQLQASDADNAVQIYGTADWAKRTGYEYSGSGAQHFSIPIGQYFTGSFSRLVFLAKDAAGQDQQQTFANLKIYEGDPQESVVIATWDFDGEGHDIVSSVADTYDPGLSTSAPSLVIEHGPGLIPESWSWADGFTSKGQDKLTLAEAIADGDYHTFTLTPESGNMLTVTDLYITWFSQNSNDRQFAIMTDQQAFVAGNELASGNVLTGTSSNVALSGLSNISDPLEIRIYYYGATNRYQAMGTNHNSGNEIEVSGYVTTQNKAKVSIDELAAPQVSVYPNPVSSGYLTVDLGTESAQSSIYVFDMQGRLHIAQQLGNASQSILDVSQLSKGIYIMKVQSDSGSSMCKFSVQ